MKAITILKRCRDAEGEIERLDVSIRQKADILTNIAAPQGDPNGGGHGSGSGDKTGRVMADKIDLERRKKEREEALMVELAAASALLDMVPSLESRILHRYYVQRKSMAVIAKELKYQLGYSKRKKREGERILDLLSPERVRETLPVWYVKKYGGEKE